MDAATLTAIAAIIAALTGLVGAIGAIVAVVLAQRNRVAINAVETKVAVVDSKVDGQMTTLTRLATTVDPSIAAEAAAKVLITAEKKASGASVRQIPAGSIDVNVIPGEAPLPVEVVPAVKR